MTARERGVERRTDDSRSDSGSIPTPPRASRAAPPLRRRRIWLLPTATDTPLAVAERAGEALEAPQLLHATLDYSSDKRAAAKEAFLMPHRDRLHDATFRMISRGLLGFGWVIVALAALRAAGEIKLAGELLLLGGTVFLGYAVIRHGGNLLLALQNRARAAGVFNDADAAPDGLLDRLASALKVRRKTDPAQRGEAPDIELLDAGAYRSLISDGVTTAADLVALGMAVAERLGLDAPDAAEKKSSQLAQEAGVDLETLIFYKDLSAAAKVLELESGIGGLS
jgi:hypothetical protein